MSIGFIDSRSETPTHSIRVMSPLGVYPAESVINTNSAFITSEDICFSVVPHSRDRIDVEHYYSEVEWATINEIKLFSSILQCVDREIGYSRIYPFHTSHPIKVPENEAIVDHISSIGSQLVEAINAPQKNQWLFTSSY